jgi:hypothetical protein
MRSLVLGIAVLAVLATGCGSSFKGVCNKAEECCARLSICEDINKQGKGWQDRCGIGGDALIGDLHTYGNSLCDKIANAEEDYVSCLSGVSCTDISNTAPDVGHVAKCDDKAAAYCQAQKASGDACGNDYSNQSCDNAKASIGFFL